MCPLCFVSAGATFGLKKNSELMGNLPVAVTLTEADVGHIAREQHMPIGRMAVRVDSEGREHPVVIDSYHVFAPARCESAISAALTYPAVVHARVQSGTAASISKVQRQKSDDVTRQYRRGQPLPGTAWSRMELDASRLTPYAVYAHKNHTAGYRKCYLRTDQGQEHELILNEMSGGFDEVKADGEHAQDKRPTQTGASQQQVFKAYITEDATLAAIDFEQQTLARRISHRTHHRPLRAEDFKLLFGNES